MDHDLLDGAACAASDLTARLLADLARANERMALAEARVRTRLAAGATVPDAWRAERRSCRAQVASLLQVLSGMPAVIGGRHAASA